MGKRIPTNYFCWKKLEKMVQQELVEDIETVEQWTYAKAMSELRKYAKKLKKSGLYLMVSIEGWELLGQDVVKKKQLSLQNGDTYESILSVYPVKDGQVLMDLSSGEILCAAVIFCRVQKSGSTWEMNEEAQGIRQICSQVEELLEELEAVSWAADAKETRCIQQAARRIGFI